LLDFNLLLVCNTTDKIYLFIQQCGFECMINQWWTRLPQPTIFKSFL